MFARKTAAECATVIGVNLSGGMVREAGQHVDFMAGFDFREALERVTIDVSRAHIWDISSVAALDMAVLKFRRDGAEVEIVGMNAASETIVDRLAVHNKPGALDQLAAH